jgi:hypothetical protein
MENQGALSTAVDKGPVSDTAKELAALSETGPEVGGLDAINDAVRESGTDVPISDFWDNKTEVEAKSETIDSDSADSASLVDTDSDVSSQTIKFKANGV